MKVGDVVKKTSSVMVSMSGPDGQDRNQLAGAGVVLYAGVKKVEHGRCLIQFIKDFELNPGIAGSYAGKWAWAPTSDLTVDDKCKRINQALAYDGESIDHELVKKVAVKRARGSRVEDR